MTRPLKKPEHIVFGMLMLLLTGPLLVSAQLNFEVQKIDMPKPFHRAYIQQLVQDDQGLIYFTTNQGIWRYDGTDVQPFSIPSVSLPDGSLVADLFCFENYVFFCYRKDPHFIYCYNKVKHQLRHFRVPFRYKYSVNPKNHQLYLFTIYGESYLFNEKSGFQKQADLKKYRGWDPKITPENYLFDNNGRLYLILRNNIARVDGKTLKKGKGDSILINNTYQEKVRINREGTYITDAYCTSRHIVTKYLSGFAVYDKQTLDKVYEYHNGAEGFNTFVCTFPQGDSIMVVCKKTINGAALPIPKGPFRQFSDVYPYSGLHSIWKSAMPGSYFAASADHLYALTPAAQHTIDTALINSAAAQIGEKSIRGIYAEKGHYYVGTYNDMFSFSRSGTKRFPFLAYTIQPSGKDELMIGIEGGDGFYTLNTQSGKLDTLPNPEHDYLGVTKLLKYHKGFLAGMRNRIYTVSKDSSGRWGHQILTNDAGVDIIKDLAYIDGRLWVAGEMGLAVQEGRNFKKIPVDGQMVFPVYAILPYKNSIFLATSGKGIIQIDHQGKKLRQLKFINGLAGDFVYSLLQTDGFLFAGTNGGLSVFDMEQGMQPLSHPDDDRFEEQYNQEFNHSAIFYDEDRRQVIMGGLQGLLFLNVDRYKAMRGSKTTGVILSYVRKGFNTARTEPVDLFAGYDESIVVRPGENLLSLKLAGAFKQPEVLFRIREISEEWRKSKLSEEISLYSLSPGTYTFQARFPFNTDPAYWLTKTIIVKPSFYQSWAFKVLIGLLIVFIVYRAWLSRVKKLRSEMELRTSIASDLHDEIGSTLTRISLSSELMYVKREADEGIIRHISNDSKNAISSISDIIWSVDSRNDSKEDLISRMQQHVYNMLDGAGEVSFDVYGIEKQGTLPQLVRQNIYLIFKEAINNIVRHNRDPSVWVTLDNQPSGMTITIENSINLNPASGYTGQGLKNMKMRAKRINGCLTISNDGKFFLVKLTTKRW